MMHEGYLPDRKRNRLSGFEYSQNSLYFLTICTLERKMILSDICIGDVFNPAIVKLTEFGQITDQYIVSSKNMKGITILNYVIMPNHIHILLRYIGNSGSSRAPTPTNAAIPQHVSTLKRLINRQIVHNIWQRGYYDHIIRDESDYRNTWQYIDNNPAHWAEDKYYYA